VDSLLAQDITDYEIILVDDGSPDECPQICNQYAEQYSNINVIHQENAGLSAARNSGISAAQGEYVLFVDSDDYLQSNVLGTLMAQVKRDNLDVLRFNYQNVDEQYEAFLPYKDAKRDVDYSEDVVDGETFLNKRLGPACYAVMFIIRRELLQNCLFTPNIYFEDTDWTPRMLIKAERVASTLMVVYNYLWRQGSITLPTEPHKREKVLRDKMSLLYGFKAQVKLVHDTSWFVWMTSFNTMTILNMLAAMPSSERKSYLHKLKSLRIFPLYTKKEKGLKRLKIQIANLSPALYCRLMSLRTKRI
jgi:glycosyltransferase involved in cell wall biosynthesis